MLDHSLAWYLLLQIKWSQYKKVPTLVVETPDGKIMQLCDSTMIISALFSFLVDQQQGNNMNRIGPN